MKSLDTQDYVDFENAFDKIIWVKLMEILAEIGIDWRVRTLIWELYINQKAFVMVGETLLEACSIGRAVRQGCSLTLSIVVYHLWSEKSATNV